MIHLSESEITLNKPINVRGNLISKIPLLNLHYEESKLNFSISHIDHFHQIKLSEKKEYILNYFHQNHFNLVQSEIDQLPNEVAFQIESIILSFHNQQHCSVHFNLLDEYNLKETSVVKLKLSNDLITNHDFIKKLNDFLTNPNLIKIRFDGNQKLDKFKFDHFLYELWHKDKIEYIEEPLHDPSLSYEVLEKYQIALCIDESLGHVSSDLNYQYQILRPTFLGLNKTRQMINHSQKISIISSSYDFYDQMVANIIMADLSNKVSHRDLFHGLDTQKFFPDMVKKLLTINNKISI